MPTEEEKKKMLILVTGINGYVGSNLVLRLTDKGYHVRGTVRNPLNIESYNFLFLKWVLGDE